MNPNENFQNFFSVWLNLHEALLQKLLNATAPENEQNTKLHLDLIDLVSSHYKHYYQEKANAAKDDPFLFLQPPWLSSLERALLWLGDFKPSVIFRLINRDVTDLSHEQNERIEQLIAKTRREEKELTETMARIQESLASPRILNLARRSEVPINGEISEMEEAEEMLKAEMRVVWARADVLRGSTAGNAVEILSPFQAVRFLAAAIDHQLRMRRWGQQRDAHRPSTSIVPGGAGNGIP